MGLGWREHSALASALLVIVAVLAASATGLDNGFAYDDLVLIADNARVQTLRWPWEYFAESYWGPARGSDLYRPLTVFGFAIQWAMGNGAPLPFHIVNVALYAASALAVLWLARQLVSPGAALLGALVFAVHPVHVEAVGNVVGQAELVTAIAMLAAIALYVRDRRRGPLRPRTALLIAALYMTALFVKEHAVVLPALLLAAEFMLSPSVLRTREHGDGARIRILILLLSLVALAYLTLRLTVIGEFTGDAPHPGIAQLGPGQRAWVMLGLIPEFARLLLWPARLYADYAPQLIVLRPTPGVAHLPGLLMLGGWLGVLLVGWRRSRPVAFVALWLPVTLLLVSNVFVPTGVLLAERTLFLPSVAVAIGLGMIFAGFWNDPRRADGRWFGVGRVAVCVLLVLGAMRSAARQAAWEDNAAVISTMIAEAPDLYRGHLMLGQTLAVFHEFERAEPPLRRAVELYPGFPSAQLDFARVLQLLDRCDEALPHFAVALQLEPASQVGQVNQSICLLETRRLKDARLRALEGLAEGVSPSAFRAIRWTADSMLLATDSADSRNLFARSGRAFDRRGGRMDLRIRYVLPSALPPPGKVQDSLPSDAERNPK